MREWYSLQRKFYEEAQHEITASISKKSKTLSDYENRYKKDLKKLKASTQRKMFQAINSADFLFIGDFHSLPQSQRFVLRLLRNKQIKKPKAIAFEVISKEHEAFITAYLQKPTKQKELKLREQLSLEENWSSNFEVYLEIFKAAHSQKIKIKGLKTSAQNLKKRDLLAAKQISQSMEPLWVLFGEFHCAREHLPKLVRELNLDKSTVVIQQNIDHLQLKGLKESFKQKDKIYADATNKKIPLFCILHTPLWVKWQSYLTQHIRKLEDSSSFDPTDQIHWSMNELSSFLEDSRYPLVKADESFFDFSVLHAGEEDFSKSIRKLPRAEERKVLQQLELGGVAISTKTRRIFLAELTLNSCAQAASTYLYSAWTKQDPQQRDFFMRCLFECHSFFLSKILNHSRKAKYWGDWKALLKDRRKSSLAKKVLQTQDFILAAQNPEQWTKKLKPHAKEVAQALGRMIADWCFEAFLAGEFSKQRLLRHISEPPENERQAIERLLELQSVGKSFSSKNSALW